MKPAASWTSPSKAGDSAPSALEETPTLMAASEGEPGIPAVPEPPVHLGRGFVDEGEIGVGGSGSVHRVLDLKLQRRVAMKTMAPRLAGKVRHAQRFVREAQIVAQLDHPNVPPIHDLGFDSRGRPFFIMKLVDGQTLRDRVREQQDRLGDPQVLGALLGAFVKVCEAVAFAHSRGICHCDIKPANIMVGAYGEVYLMDWGIAMRAGTGRGDDLPVVAPEPGRPRAGIRGTPAYMAPEQAAGRVELIGERTDIFGLGTVLYFIVTGAAPFEGRSATESVQRARHSRLHAPERLGAVAPAALQRVIRKAMAPAINDRHASVLELRDEVEAILRGSWHLPTRRFPPGARIVTEGQPGDAAFVILSGRCVVTKRAGARFRVLRRLGPGDVFGETAVLSRRQRTATVEAVDEVVVRVVTREVLERELGVGTDLGKFVLAMADRFCQLDEKVSQLEERARRQRRQRPS